MIKFTLLFAWIVWKAWDFLDYFFEDSPKRNSTKLPSNEEFDEMSPANQKAWIVWSQKDERTTPPGNKKAQ